MINLKYTFAAIVVSATTTLPLSGLLANTDVQCAKPIGQELALAAGVAAVYARHEETTYLGDNGAKREAVRYQGILDFVAHNPSCCTFTPLGKDDFEPSLDWSERNSFYGFVRATFEASWENNNGKKKIFYQTRIVAVTTCGNAIWYNVDDDNF